MNKHDFLHYWPRFDEPHTDEYAKKFVPSQKSRVSLLPIHYSVILCLTETAVGDYGAVAPLFLLRHYRNNCLERALSY